MNNSAFGGHAMVGVLTKRELLAAMAMHALVTNERNVRDTPPVIAERAVEQADALVAALSALEKREK